MRMLDEFRLDVMIGVVSGESKPRAVVSALWWMAYSLVVPAYCFAFGHDWFDHDIGDLERGPYRDVECDRCGRRL